MNLAMMLEEAILTYCREGLLAEARDHMAKCPSVRTLFVSCRFQLLRDLLVSLEKDGDARFFDTIDWLLDEISGVDRDDDDDDTGEDDAEPQRSYGFPRTTCVDAQGSEVRALYDDCLRGGYHALDVKLSDGSLMEMMHGALLNGRVGIAAVLYDIYSRAHKASAPRADTTALRAQIARQLAAIYTAHA